MLLEWIASILLVSGSIFMLIAAVGIVRFPDALLRMHASTKAASFGTLLMLLGVSFFFAKLSIIWESFLIIAFIFLTKPIAAHMISRAAHRQGTPLWEQTEVDEFKERDGRGMEHE